MRVTVVFLYNQACACHNTKEERLAGCAGDERYPQKKRNGNAQHSQYECWWLRGGVSVERGM